MNESSLGFALEMLAGYGIYHPMNRIFALAITLHHTRRQTYSLSYSFSAYTFDGMQLLVNTWIYFPVLQEELVAIALSSYIPLLLILYLVQQVQPFMSLF